MARAYHCMHALWECEGVLRRGTVGDVSLSMVKSRGVPIGKIGLGHHFEFEIILLKANGCLAHLLQRQEEHLPDLQRITRCWDALSVP
jgi:hypothetical protein